MKLFILSAVALLSTCQANTGWRLVGERADQSTATIAQRMTLADCGDVFRALDAERAYLPQFVIIRCEREG
jgi:hypothetical protein